MIPSLLSSAVAEEPGQDQPKAPAGERRVYKYSGGAPRELELFFPTEHDPKRPGPGLILFHGGSWRAGSLAQFREACRYFADRGLVCATAEYQMMEDRAAESLPPGVSRKRVCITDAKSAIRWFKQHAAELGVDPARIITGGGSAGGHISALATLNPGLNDPADPEGIDTSVVAYVWFNPGFLAEDEHDPQVDMLQFVRRELPPAIVFFGTNDCWKEGWDAVYDRFMKIGCRTIDLRLAQNEKHGFFNNEPWRSATLIAADRFLAELGLLEGKPTRTVPEPGAELRAGNLVSGTSRLMEVDLKPGLQPVVRENAFIPHLNPALAARDPLPERSTQSRPLPRGV